MAAFLGGCAVADFTSYSGYQQNWPTQPGSFVSNKYVIPVYLHSWPDRSYTVLGYLDATTAPIRRFGTISFCARRAQELGADAIVVLNEGTEYRGTVNTGNAFYWGNGFSTFNGMSVPLLFGKAQVLAIKWKV
jgi:hypothetical protein